jgi:hypothetical protein
MSLHVVIPGLLWPRVSLRETVRDLALPALATLLGRGERRMAPGQDALDWLRDAFGLNGPEVPWGALRRRGETDPDSDGVWLCADPAHLRYARDALVLVDAGQLEIELGEAHDIVGALNAHFPEVGRFQVATPQRWYLRVPTLPDIRTRALDRVIGRNFALFLPEGGDQRRWRALLNEAQMLLHAHPRNAAREAGGRPTLNTLWLWGAGAAPPQLRRGFDVVFGNDPLLIGIARTAGIEARPLPTHAADMAAAVAGQRVLAILDTLQAPALHRDASAWRGEIARLERDWFATLLGRVYGDGLGELHITGLGDEATLDLSLTAQGRWKFWRRPLSLGDLDYGAGTA